jgi:hypothetical protein
MGILPIRFHRAAWLVLVMAARYRNEPNTIVSRRANTG